MILNIYDKEKNVVKTYKTDTYDLMFGTMEDIAKAVDIDNLETINNAEIVKLIGRLMTSGMGTVKNLMKDIFPGLTDEELKNTKIVEITNVLLDAVVFTVAQLYESFGGSEKN